jgi:SH3-like domain-containing protein
MNNKLFNRSLSKGRKAVVEGPETQCSGPSFDALRALLRDLLGIFLTFFFLTTTPAHASRAITEVNYFASLRAAETNVRAGPGQNYPIKFTFKLRGLPVRVINEYDNWNEIEDYDGQTGWVTQSLLTKKRTLMVRTTKTFINMHSKNNEKSRIIFRLENNVIGDYLKCLDDWCGIKVNNKKGWVPKAELFGADEK